jgi:hypothetical protein
VPLLDVLRGGASNLAVIVKVSVVIVALRRAYGGQCEPTGWPWRVLDDRWMRPSACCGKRASIAHIGLSALRAGQR